MSFVVSIKRVIRNGFINFLRNGVISFATIFIMVITLFSIATSIYVNAAINSVISSLEKKVDINIYFSPDTTEEIVLSLKKKLEALPEVESVEYISADKALLEFKEKNKSDPATLKALEELDENPLGPSLAIKAKDIRYYDSIAKFLQSDKAISSDNRQYIEQINYFKNKYIIDKLIRISDNLNKLGLAVITFLLITSSIIVFNTIRLAIISTKDEISILKLVGASNWYARGPFIIEAALYGFVAGLFVFIILYPLSIYLDPTAIKVFGSFSTKEFFEENFLLLFGATVGVGTILGAISSFFAAKKYLKV